MSWCRTLKLLLQSELDDMTIEYKQWTVTDKATLMTVTWQSNKLIENRVSMMPEMTHHYYTARKQARYLKRVKIKSAVQLMHNFDSKKPRRGSH
jgi:hypothetical protein